MFDLDAHYKVKKKYRIPPSLDERQSSKAM